MCLYNELLKSQSQVNGSGQLLDLVQQMVSLFECSLVQLIPLIRRVRLDYARYFIDLARQSSRPDQFRQFSIDELHRHSKLVCHGFQLDSFVGLQELRVNDDPCFSHKVPGVVQHIGIISDCFNDVDKHLEEFFVSAVVKGLQIFLDIWQFHEIDNRL